MNVRYDPPYSDDAFDRVLSSLVFHHMTHKRKVEIIPGAGLVGT
jgi:hypothetical protein